MEEAIIYSIGSNNQATLANVFLDGPARTVHTRRVALWNSTAFRSLALALFVFSTAGLGWCAERHAITIDFARANGVLRALHGINKGPLVAGGLLDLTERQRELAPPFNRLHDCHWPNPDVVDIHAVFPNSDADPARPESYQFAATDEYLAAVQATGAGVVYRLGESIEHTKLKRFVHPPRDSGRWAAACVGIVRHCNEGWAGGTRLGIQYWEIWNEPENRPVMWTGSDDDFLRLYAATSNALKAHDAKLKVGGPSFGYTGQFVNGEFRASAFVTNFLAMCRRDAPLDFFSWHCYTADPAELVARARAIRSLLDSFGFTHTESHLNEWNYLPGNSWTALSRKAQPEARQQACDETSGAAGAAFVAAALIELQDAPVDVCNLYHADTGCLGLFSEQGVPLKNFYAMRAFRELVEARCRVAVEGAVPGRLAVAAGLVAGSEARVLVSNFRHEAAECVLSLRNLPWDKASHTEVSVRMVDATRSFELVPATLSGSQLVLRLPAPACALVHLRAVKQVHH